MSAKSILFDLDGTLTDSGEGIMKCAKLALEYYDIPVPDINALRVFVGPPLVDSFVRFGIPASEANNAVEIYRSRYLTVGKFENFPYPGIHDLLRKLKNDGHKLYVATSKPETTSIEILEHFELAEYFDIIAGASMDSGRSSKADVIAYLLRQCQRTEEIIMVGDTAYDVIGAKAHGIPTIGVSWGYGEVADMEKAGAAAIVTTMDALYAHLK